MVSLLLKSPALLAINKSTDIFQHNSRPVSRVVKMSPFHGEDQGFDPPTGYFCGIINLMFSGGVTVAQRFLVPLVGVRISTGESLLR